MLLALLAGCTETDSTTFDHCEVDGVLSPLTAAPGDEVIVSGGPFTEPYDTRVQLDGADAVIVDVVREDCDDCDDCYEDVECDPCSACLECDTWCAECLEQTVFTVPELEPGPVDVVLLNRFGSTAVMVLEVTEVPE